MNALFENFTSADKRLYWGFILSSMVIAYAYLGFKRIDIDHFFSRRYLFHPSSLLDIKLFILNSFLKTFLFSTVLISSYHLALIFLKQLRSLTPFFDGLQLPDIIVSLIMSVVSFVLTDFLRFVFHLFMHKFLWPIHRLHHSAEVLTPLTLFRAHPLEVLLGQLRNLVGQTWTLLIMVYFFQGQVLMIDILGVNIFGFLFNAVGSNLRHGHIPISFGKFEHFFISPRMHQLHHSAEAHHRYKNYGTALSVWDKLFGSFKAGVDQKLNYGVEGADREYTHSLKSLLYFVR